jgi:hypothetical protein
MPRAAGRPAGPGRSLWDPQQSHVAEETGQKENSLSAMSGRSVYFRIPVSHVRC